MNYTMTALILETSDTKHYKTNTVHYKAHCHVLAVKICSYIAKVMLNANNLQLN